MNVCVLSVLDQTSRKAVSGGARASDDGAVHPHHGGAIQVSCNSAYLRVHISGLFRSGGNQETKANDQDLTKEVHSA